MIWINDIHDLDYYHRSPSDYCYCDLLLDPHDLTLQGRIPFPSVNNAVEAPVIHLYSVDGLTDYGDVSEAFDWFVAGNSSAYYFVIRLNYWHALMCSNPCFILRVTLASADTTYFDKYTEQYCVDNCCILTSGVGIIGPEILQDAPIVPIPPAPAAGKSCHPVLRIEVKFDCFDRFTGDFWNLAPITIADGRGHVMIPGGGSGAFYFSKVLNIQGTLFDSPLEITRQISLNCRVQKTQSIPKYSVESFEQFPLWKRKEIELMLHANHLTIGGVDYKFPGGTVFTSLYPKKCKDYFRMVLPLEGCTTYQIFGCSETCEGDNVKYYGLQRDAGKYYDEAGNFIGSTFDSLLGYFRNQDGVTDAREVGGDAVIPVYKIFRVSGSGYIPTSFYAGGRTRNFKIYGRTLLTEYPDYNSLFGITAAYVPCKTPVADPPEIQTLTCQTPVAGSVTFDITCQTPAAGTTSVELM